MTVRTMEPFGYDHERWRWETFYCPDCAKLHCSLRAGERHCRACGDRIRVGVIHCPCEWDD